MMALVNASWGHAKNPTIQGVTDKFLYQIYIPGRRVPAGKDGEMQKVDVFAVVKDIPFEEIQQAFNGEEVRRGKILCPFHDEKTPSFQIFDDGFKCFGCGVYGDGTDFVSKLEGIKPIKAARMIADRFGIVTDRPASPLEKKKVNELKRRRSINKMYKVLEDQAYHNLINFRDTINHIVDVVGLDDIPPVIVRMVHRLPMVEEYLRILAIGGSEEKLQLLRDGVMEEWARLNLQQMTQK